MVNIIANESDVDKLLTKPSGNFLANLTDLTTNSLSKSTSQISELEKAEILSMEARNNASKMKQQLKSISSQTAYLDIIEFCGIDKLKKF